MSMTGIDILENDIQANYPGVLEILLQDRTTEENIFWATDSYASLNKEGEPSQYGFYDQITVEKISGANTQVVQPRAAKTKEEQAQRTKDKAEVFTPAWVCNSQNNLIDEAWFERKDGLFNSANPDNPYGWINNEQKIIFPDTEGKTWKDYVADVRLEITCGEAPYLCNIYDAVAGGKNEDTIHRIGILDRKLRIVSENAKDSKEWILWGKIALRATYGFEWQGDNLLLSREAMLYTFADHYIARFGEKTFRQNKSRMMKDVAYIISWNIWQMDGLKYGLPGYTPDPANEPKEDDQPSLFDFSQDEEPHIIKPRERLCIIKDFFDGVDIHKPSLKAQDFNDEQAPTYTFKSTINQK